ncbi:MAG: hypothetical protein ACOX7D_02745 [Alphaproteobacteria bacterium]|jgi:hypothetical protein
MNNYGNKTLRFVPDDEQVNTSKKEKFNTGKNKVKKPNVYQKTNSQSR